MGIFERFLSLWVFLAIILGLLVGTAQPNAIKILSHFEYAHVNLLVALLIWLMIYPMMVQVDFKTLKQVGSKPKGLYITLMVNWIIKPFTMAALAIFFFKVVFAQIVPAESAKEYIAGLILLGIAPCTAMVFVWSQLTRGDPNYTLLQVSINDIIMVIAFAPLARFLLGINEVHVPWETLLLSVVLYVVFPLLAGYFTRKKLETKSEAKVSKFLETVKPLSVLGLLCTVTLLFAFQAERILSAPMIVLLIAVPLLIQSYGIFSLAYFWAYKWKLKHNIAAPAALIGTSNFFELAVAVAIGLFGLNSGASLATVVGVLIEVPVMLSLVRFANKTRNKFS